MSNILWVHSCIICMLRVTWDIIIFRYDKYNIRIIISQGTQSICHAWEAHMELGTAGYGKISEFAEKPRTKAQEAN